MHNYNYYNYYNVLCTDNNVWFFVQIQIYSSSARDTRGFNGSVNIPESYDLLSQFLLLNIIVQPSFLNTSLPAYTFWIKSIKQTNP